MKTFFIQPKPIPPVLLKKRAVPAPRCSPIAVFRRTKCGKTARSILRNFLWYKKRAVPTPRCSPIAVFRHSKRGKTARSILRNFLWYQKSGLCPLPVARLSQFSDIPSAAKRRGLFCAISYGTKKRAVPELRCSPIAVFRRAKRGKTASAKPQTPLIFIWLCIGKPLCWNQDPYRKILRSRSRCWCCPKAFAIRQRNSCRGSFPCWS